MNEVENAEGKEMILAGERMWVEAQWAGDMQDAIRRVRMLHVKKSIDNVDYCVTCAYPSIWDEWQIYPCNTIKALDGDK